MNVNEIISDTPETMAARVAADIGTWVRQTLQQQDRFTIALSGGVTPKLLFASLTQDPLRTQIPWDKLWFFWGDERCVPPDHSESNYGMAREYLLSKVPVSSAHVFRMRGEDPPGDSARAYSKLMHDVFKTSEEWPRFDLMIMGIGVDGHTASLMPGTAALEEERRWVVENVVRSMQTVRITMTLPVINHARQVWFLVSGAKKAAAYAKARSGPDESCPASLVEPTQGELRWYIDKAVRS